MKIKQIISQHRRDFTAIYQCEHCEFEIESGGYDDSYFHNTVIPSMECKKCGKITNEQYRALTPKYAEGYQI